MKLQKYILKNSQGMKAEILNYGGILANLWVPVASGKLEDVVLGFEDLNAYLGEHPYFGGIIGRYANRLRGAKVRIEEKEYLLAKNNGAHSLHGGRVGFDRVFWEVEELGSSALKLSRRSPHGEEGYPGNLDVSVIYSLTDQNEFKIDYSATTDQTTVLNLTNHSYFNFSHSGSVLDYELTIHADQVVEVDGDLIPTGILRAVDATDFDFRSPRKIERDYDDCFVLAGGRGSLKKCASVFDPKSGRKLEVFTTEPGLQFYTGSFLDGSIEGKNKKVYTKNSGLCLEAQHFPDSPNHAHFPSTLLKVGEEFRSTTVYRFY